MTCVFSSFIFCKPQEVLSHRSVRSVIPMHTKIVTRLQRLGLYQVAMLGNINVDPNLIAGLVERWRSECHCFNFNFGEMTVTLEDVSCLWGLSIQVELITGESDSGNYKETLERVLNRPVPETAFRRQKRNARGGEGTRVTYSGYNLRLEWLRTQFTRITDRDTEEYLDAYTIAFCLDLIGSILLPNGTGDSVPIMYVKFLENLENPPEYNWGSAVLAHLYRNLCRASDVKNNNIYGPLVLLQMWSWTRLNIARPTRADRTDPIWEGMIWRLDLHMVLDGLSIICSRIAPTTELNFTVTNLRN